jgi:5'-nucleotidase
MDQGVRLIKSGTDFRDLSEASLELEKQEEGSVRRWVVKSLKGELRAM